MVRADPTFIDLYWIPLGAGGNFVRLNGRLYEALEAALQRRPRYDLYHSALVVGTAAGNYTIEQTPAGPHGEKRGVVGVGPIGGRSLAHWRPFRYKLRCWHGGFIPDLNEAVDSPIRLSTNPAIAERMLQLAPEVPFFVWGRDYLGAGDMWNSNSQIAWLIARAGLDPDSIQPPQGGRAPGWHAGVVAASLQPTNECPATTSAWGYELDRSRLDLEQGGKESDRLAIEVDADLLRR